LTLGVFFYLIIARLWSGSSVGWAG